MKTIYLIFVFLILSNYLAATIINIPGDQPTIQAGIGAAVDADTVLVQPGTYVENINYNGKLITVGSLFLTTQDSTYISSTIIDGNSSGSVVKFENSEDSTTVLCGFTITNGSAGNGGGIFCYSSANPNLENVIITGNSGNIGGGIDCHYSSPSLKNVTISGNSCSIGGGIFCYSASNPNLENVTVTGNSASVMGGGIFCDEANPVLINSILWNNSPEEIYFFYEGYSSSITISYSDIQGGEAGIVTNNNGTVNWLEGNIDEDPLFEDPFNGNYHLTENSPCIDAGDPTSPLDPDGTISDMGAFYFDQLNAIDDNEIPISEFNLSNHPNPFNPVTSIQFDIKEHETGMLTIFNIKGQLIESHRFDSGKHNYLWDASNQASGIYLYKLQTESITETRKMILLK